jgi:hypothetical protein
MKSSPPLCIDLLLGRFAYAFWILQLLGLSAAAALLPARVGVCILVLGAALLWRAWPAQHPATRLVLRSDGTVVLVGAAEREVVLLQAQRFLGIQLLRFKTGECLCLWPDTMSAAHGRDLQRWLRLHAAAPAGLPAKSRDGLTP